MISFMPLEQLVEAQLIFFFFITGYQVPGSLVGNAPLKNIYQMHTELIKLEMYLLAKHQGFKVSKYFLCSTELYSLLERMMC